MQQRPICTNCNEPFENGDVIRYFSSGSLKEGAFFHSVVVIGSKPECASSFHLRTNQTLFANVSPGVFYEDRFYRAAEVTRLSNYSSLKLMNRPHQGFRLIGDLTELLQRPSFDFKTNQQIPPVAQPAEVLVA